MIASHSKLCMLFLDDEVVEIVRQRELIAEAETIIIEAEADIHVTLLSTLMESHQQFVVVITNVLVLTPYRLPRLVKCAGLLTGQRESALKVCLTCAGRTGSALCRVFLVGIGFQLQSKFRWINDCLSFIREFILWFSLISDGKTHLHLTIRRCQIQLVGCKGS